MVTKWLKAGRLVLSEDGKRVNAAASLARIAGEADPSRGGRNGHAGYPAPSSADDPPAPPRRAGPSFGEVRTAREAYGVKQAELDYRERVGELVERAGVERALVDALGPIVSALESLSARLGPALAAESDPRRVQNLIDAEVETIRREMADTLRRMVSGGAGTRQ